MVRLRLVWPGGGCSGGPIWGPVGVVQSEVGVPLVVVLGRLGVWLKAGWLVRSLEVGNVGWVGEQSTLG